jgi:hypothetical protein
MTPNTSTTAGDRVMERRRAVSLARHYREAEGLSIVQISDRLGRSPATIRAYFYDPTGEKARAVKARYRVVDLRAVSVMPFVSLVRGKRDPGQCYWKLDFNLETGLSGKSRWWC